MACETCNTPASSGGNLPAGQKAYLTDPISSPSQGCYTPPIDPCAPPVSRLRWLANFIPGWLQKLTPAPVGKMLIGVGDVLHYFRGLNAGTLYFDGENVTVAEQPVLRTKVATEGVIERGHLTLARKVTEPKILPDSTVANVDYFEHGVQAVREVASAELVGLTADPASGDVRLDVIAPKDPNFVKTGLPANLRRLGYSEELVDGGCGKVQRKIFHGYRGAVWGADELLLDKSGLIASLVPVKHQDGTLNYVLGTMKFEEREGVTGEQSTEEGVVLPVLVPIYGDASCPDKITGYRYEYIPFPEILTSDAGAVETEIFYDGDVLYTVTSTTGPAQGGMQTVSVADLVPAGARFAYVQALAQARKSEASANPCWATVAFHDPSTTITPGGLGAITTNVDQVIGYTWANFEDGTSDRFSAFCSNMVWVPIAEDRTINFTAKAQAPNGQGSATAKVKLCGYKG